MYKDIYSKVYRALVLEEGQFGLEKARNLAFDYCPDHYTKAQIIALAYSALDETLNNGMVKYVDEGIYESRITQQNNPDSENKIVAAFKEKFGSMSQEEQISYLKDHGLVFTEKEEASL
ncbi:MAG: hypothetical protein IJA61_03155 [Clostridia bacterium]|nr:hypothetical protein [Clostridia bacterium]